MNLHVTRQFGHPASLFLRGWCACKPEILGSSIKLCSAVPTLAARWLRFFLLLLGGDIEPNPGPKSKLRVEAPGFECQVC